MTHKPHVFISYSRQDGEAAAKDLRQRLIGENIRVWQDRTDMEGGRNWWLQITEALDNVSFMVLVATPGAMASPIVRREWQYARQQGVCIYPVFVLDYLLDFEALPNWMRKAHFYDLRHEWDNFLSHVRGDCTANRVPFMAPELSHGYVERPEIYEQLTSYLLSTDFLNPVASHVALRGTGGFGKTTLATALCHDDRIITAFDDGILWVTLGEQPDLLAEITRLVRALSGDKEVSFLDADEAGQRLSERLADLDILMVIDDVWHVAHAHPFLRGGERCARLITTRNFEIATETAHYQVSVDEMENRESVALLTSRVDDNHGDLTRWRDLARRLGDWPLLLELVGDSIHNRMARGDNLDGALEWVNIALDRRGVKAFDKRDSAERHQAISRTVDISLELLTEHDQQNYLELAIFPDDEEIPLRAACALWGMDEFDAEELIQQFFDLSLLKFDLQAGFFQLHDIIRAYLRERLPDEARFHQQLLEGWGDLYDLPDEYAWRWVSYHLRAADTLDELEHLLLDYDWIEAKLEATDPNTLILDYDQALDAIDSADLRLVQSALRNAAHVLVRDPSQLAGQLIGRLLTFESDAIGALRAQAAEYKATPWIRPLTPSLPQAGGPLVRTIQAHRKNIASVCMLADGQRALSTSSDGTIKFWSLATGLELSSWDGHDGKKVNDAVVSPDGKRLISAGSDHRLCIWNMQTGEVLRRLEGHERIVDAVAITPDGKTIVSASSDRTVRLWDIESGEQLATLTGHESMVTCVAVSPDGRYAMSGSADKSVRLWDIVKRAERAVLKEHSGFVNVVLFTPDGRRAVTGCEDGFVIVWDVASAKQIEKFQAHKRGVLGLTVTPDGETLITTSADLTLKVWNLATTKPIMELAGHTWPVNAVAVSPDGQRVLSASMDRTLKVWRLSADVLDDDPHRHAERINSLALTRDGQYAISAGADKVLNVWNLGTQQLHRSLQGHRQQVNDVALTPNGRYGVSGSSAGVLRVWDVISGLEMQSFRAHNKAINAIAITPDGKHIITGASDSTLKVWVLASGTEVMTMTGHRERVNTVDVTPDGQYAVSAAGSFFGHHPDIRIWNLSDGSLVASWVGHERKVNRLAVTPDGIHVVTVSDDKLVKVWSIEDQQAILTLGGHTERVNGVAISRDGQYILSAGDDGRLLLWTLTEGEIVAAFQADDALFACAMADDNKTVVAGGSSGRVHFLKLMAC